MQKRINIVSTLLLVSLALGFVLYCTGSDVLEAWNEGEREAFADFESDSVSSYEKGYEAGLAASEKMPFHKGTVNVVPLNYSEYSETVSNAMTGDEIQMSLREIKVLLPETTNKLQWISIVLAIIAFFAIVFFVWQLLSFIIEVKRGNIFVKSNEWKLSCMGVVSIFWFVADWVTEIIEYSFLRSNVSIDGYVVVMDYPALFPLIIGLVFLLFSAVFSLGRKMSEEQEFTV